METVSTFATFDNIYALMFKILGDFGGLGLEDLVWNLVSIDCNSSSIFQGHKTRVTQQFKEKAAPFVTKVHCFAHTTNFTVITLLDVPLVYWLELFLQNIYAFSTHSLKKIAEFQKMVDLL